MLNKAGVALTPETQLYTEFGKQQALDPKSHNSSLTAMVKSANSQGLLIGGSGKASLKQGWAEMWEQTGVKLGIRKISMA